MRWTNDKAQRQFDEAVAAIKKHIDRKIGRVIAAPAAIRDLKFEAYRETESLRKKAITLAIDFAVLEPVMLDAKTAREHGVDPDIPHDLDYEHSKRLIYFPAH